MSFIGLDIKRMIEMLCIKAVSVNPMTLGIIYDDLNNQALCFRSKEEFISCLIELGINVNEMLDYFLKEEIEGEFKVLGWSLNGIL